MVGRTKVSRSRIWLWLHGAVFLYSTTDPPVCDRRPPGPRSASSGPQDPAWLHEVPEPSAGPQAGQFGRSEAEAKLHLFGLDPDPRTTVASCAAIRGPDPGTWTSLPAQPRSLWESHRRLQPVFQGPKARNVWFLRSCETSLLGKRLSGSARTEFLEFSLLIGRQKDGILFTCK